MKRLSPALLLLWLAASVAWAEVPTTNVLYRVLRLRTAAGLGSAFTIEVDGRQYLITARHNLRGFGSEGRIDLWIGGRWTSAEARAIYPSSPLVDVAALDFGRPLTVAYPLEPTSAGLFLGQQVYFLGYPYALGSPLLSPPVPGFGEVAFLKSGIVSAFDNRNRQANILYLDGQNNPGFSGGPIVFWHAETGRFRVAGVVRGYRNEALPVLKKGDLSDPDASAHNDLYARANSGIVVGYDISHIIDAIRAANRRADPLGR